jgi:hypothetical protein
VDLHHPQDSAEVPGRNNRGKPLRNKVRYAVPVLKDASDDDPHRLSRNLVIRFPNGWHKDDVHDPRLVCHLRMQYPPYGWLAA